MNTFVIRAETTLSLGYMIDPPKEPITSYLSQTVETDLIASRNVMIKVSIRGATYLIDFAICEPNCGSQVSLFLIDIVSPHLTGKYPDPMVHLLSQTDWPFDLPKTGLPLSDSLLLLANRTDPSSFRLMLLADPDNYKMTPGMQVKSSIDYKHLQSTTNGLLIVLGRDDSIDVFRCKACSNKDVRREPGSFNDSATTQPFDTIFDSWQKIDHGLSAVSNIRVQLLSGGMSYLFVWTKNEAKVFIAHSGSHQSLQWATRFVFMDKALLSDEAAKIIDVFMHSEMLKFLRPSSKLVVASTKKRMVTADTYHFCNPNEQDAQNLQNCVPLEAGQVRLDWQPSKDPLSCAPFDPSASPLERVTWAAYCLSEVSKKPPAGKQISQGPSLKQLLEVDPIFGSVGEVSPQVQSSCLSITSSNRCNYRKDCLFDSVDSECQAFDFSANNGFLAKESKYHYYETGRLAWELLISKNLWKSPAAEERETETTSSSFQVVFNSSEKIER